MVSRRSVLAAAAAIGGAAVLPGCGRDPDGARAATASRGVRLTDQRGAALTFDEPVTRVVTLPMPAAAMLVAVDSGADSLAGMHEASWAAMRDGVMGEMFPSALDVPHDIAGQEFAPNVEAILALDPDVVVQWGDKGSGIIAPLENAGMTVLGLRYGTLEDVTTWITLFAAMLGKRERGAEMTSRIAEEVARAESAAAAAPSPGPSVLYFNRFAEGLKVAGRGTYNDEYIALVGATNPATGPDGVGASGMVGVDVEQVLAWDPDIVLLGNFDSAVPDDLYSDPVWTNLSAVRSRRVYKVPLGGYRWDPPSQESPLMWRWLSQVAFPSQQPSELRGVMGEYYEFLYGQRPSEEQADRILQMGANAASAGYEQLFA